MKTLNTLGLLWLPGLLIALALAGCSDSSEPPQSEPAPTTHTIGGTVSNLVGTVVLALKDETLVISENGDFTFASRLANNTDYQITILIQPETQQCQLENASGSLASADVSNVQLVCADAPLFSIGGVVENLNGALELTLNDSHIITLSTDDSDFDFGTKKLKDNTEYSVEITSQPATQSCDFVADTNTGTVAGEDVTSIRIQCETTTEHSVSGTVSGLTASMTLQLNDGDDITVSGGASSFSFDSQRLKFGDTYTVSIVTQPLNQLCGFIGNSQTGTVTGDVTDVRITCQPTFAIGGTINNLNGDLTLRLNEGDLFTRNISGDFTVPNVRLLSNATYNLSIESQPTNQQCVFTSNSGSGTVGTTNVDSINIACTNTYSVSGSVNGLNGSVNITLSYGNPTTTQELTRTSDGDFTFAERLLNDTTYQVTAASLNQNCNALPSGGKISGEDVEVTISCSSFDAATLELELDAIKTFHFRWSTVADADEYELFEDADGNSGPAELTQLAAYSADQAVEGQLDHSHIVPLFSHDKATYELRTCATGDNLCQISNLNIHSYPELNYLVDAIGYFKASNPDGGDRFGYSVSLSDDGTVMAVGAHLEDGNATGVNQEQNNDDNFENSGAVYVFRYHTASGWQQEAYIKASNSGAGDRFGQSLDLSGDGTYLAVGAPYEDSPTTGVHNTQQAENVQGDDPDFTTSGAVYLFQSTDEGWQQQLYIKASNTGQGDRFGSNVSLDKTGSVLAIGAPYEDSDATGIGGDQTNNNGDNSGAVYIYQRGENQPWQPTEPIYLKARHNDTPLNFGDSLDLSGDGQVLAVGATGDQSSTGGVDPDAINNQAENAGAVYVFRRNDEADWAAGTNHYLKASNPGRGDQFGYSVALNHQGTRLAVGAPDEDGAGIGVRPNPVEDSNDVDDVGAVYLFHLTDQGWQQDRYLKPFHSAVNYNFGTSLSFDEQGNRLVVGSPGEELDPPFSAPSHSIGINNDYAETLHSGAAYSFIFHSDQWHQESFIKASNTREAQYFGNAVAISSGGHVLAIGAKQEMNAAPEKAIDHGVTFEEDDDFTSLSTGAVYLY